MYIYFALDWLHETDLDVLVEELGPVQANWEPLGQALQVTEENLAAIRTSYAYPRDCLRELIRVWLPGLANWGALIHALRSVGEDFVCSELKKKYGEWSSTESLPIPYSGPELLLL